eukprot:TRINITY_DN12578_c0_g1_i1.p1 TRINITY_DN12578_c0_g1~~TRINITY_DN12578_c0_g1_i1.p1  ORF type:complete len:673 (-),score=352.26 TRINITY_DN12578_c0_g1_i1:525-2543(-)
MEESDGKESEEKESEDTDTGPPSQKVENDSEVEAITTDASDAGDSDSDRPYTPDRDSSSTDSPDVARRSGGIEQTSLRRGRGRSATCSMRTVAESALIAELQEEGEQEVDVSSANKDPLAFSILPRCAAPTSTGRSIEEKKMKMFERMSKAINKELAQYKVDKQNALKEKETAIRTIEEGLKKELAKQSQDLQNQILQDQRALMEIHMNEKKALEAKIAAKNAADFAALQKMQKKQRAAKKKELQERAMELKKGISDAAEAMAEADKLQAKEMLSFTQNQELDELRLKHNHEEVDLAKRNKLAARQAREQNAKQLEHMIKQLTLKLDAQSRRRWIGQESHREKYTLLQVWQNNEFALMRKMQNDIHTTELALLKEQQALEWADAEKKISSRMKTESSHLKKTLKKQKKEMESKAAKEGKSKKSAKSKEKGSGRLSKEAKQFVEEGMSKFAANQYALQQHETSTLARRHHEQTRVLKAEHKMRKALLMEQSQKSNNELQEQISKETSLRELEIQAERERFEQEQTEMREMFAGQQSELMLALQDQQFKEGDLLQEQQAKDREEMSSKQRTEISENPYFAAEERARIEAEEARRRAEEEAERRRAVEEERRQAEEKLKREVEEQKQQVLESRIREKTPEDHRMEYIRKIAMETGLSEEIIAKNMKNMGMGYRYL